MNCTRCYFALFMLICFDLTAQIVSIEEIIGIDSTYIKENYKGAIYGKESYAIRNKNALFKDTESYFIEYAQLRGSYPVIEISSKEEFDVYVKVFFAPFFKEVEGENLDRKYLTITLFSDIEGKMTDIEIYCNADIDLPASAVELFHKTVHRGNLRLVFNKAAKAFLNSPWVSRPYNYSYSTLKEMANNH